MNNLQKLALFVTLFIVFVSTVSAIALNNSTRYDSESDYKLEKQAVRSGRGQGWFFETFDGTIDEFKKFWEFAGFWANGQPFNNGWDPSYYRINKWSILELILRRQKFERATGTYDYTSGELRSKGYYSTGCYSVCMKPSAESGVSSSFYLLNTKWDSPFPRPAGDSFHNEIDIEFVGKDTTKMQSNFFSRQKDDLANAGSGNEQWHDLGFDAAKSFHSYSFKWSSKGIEWYVSDKLVRTTLRKDNPEMPDANYSPMKVVANVWPVDKNTVMWAGEVSPNMTCTSSQYAWIKFEAGENCNILTSCGF